MIRGDLEELGLFLSALFFCNYMIMNNYKLFNDALKYIKLQ